MNETNQISRKNMLQFNPAKYISEETMLNTSQATKEMIQAMQLFAQSNLNTIIGGACGAGKTELLGWYLGAVNDSFYNQGILVSERLPELDLDSRYPNKIIINLANGFSLEDSSSLRKILKSETSYFVSGDLRTPLETYNFLQLLQAGINGATTFQGTTSTLVLDHLHSHLMLSNDNISKKQYGDLIVSSMDAIFLQKSLPDGSRTIAELAEVVGYEGDEFILNPLFQLDIEAASKGEKNHKQVGFISELLANKLLRAGIEQTEFDFLIKK
ncbi:P-loop NTPase family protein [Viridibacillus arvi]|uniref:ATPase, T2SS/T4P/T4SS family n=1 Tax=Viridibacillus arvi TaxID=263475 RepID=UPI0034CD6881